MSVSQEMPLEVNLENLLAVLRKVTDGDDLGFHLGVPKHELDRIRQCTHWKPNRKTTMLRWWLNNDLAEWERVISALRAMKKPVLADAVAVVCKCESLHESPTEESPRGDRNIRMIKLLEAKLKEVEERFQLLVKEWEKGENEWREFLMELKKVKEVWEDLMKSQQTERAFLTLGISLLDYRDLEPLHQTDALEHKAQELIEKYKELRESYERATEHRNGLQNTEKELENLENALLKHELELKKHIPVDEMEELRLKFPREAKDCRERLQKSQEQLQTCRKKMNECTRELTKSHRQLEKCRGKLTECEESVENCRGELDNSHSQITQCIEKLRKRSQDLSGKAKLTVAAGGVLGAGVGTGTSAVASTVVALAELPVGPMAAVGAGIGVVGGLIVSHMRKNEYDEIRKKVQKCESELNDSSKVFKSCKEVLLKSKEELKWLQRTVSELEQFLLTGN